MTEMANVLVTTHLVVDIGAKHHPDAVRLQDPARAQRLHGERLHPHALWGTRLHANHPPDSFPRLPHTSLGAPHNHSCSIASL